jgi:hypothetical protein
MKNSIVAFLFFASILTSQNSRSANLLSQEETPEAVNLFYSDLVPFGEWIEIEPGLYAWRPSNMDPSWPTICSRSLGMERLRLVLGYF